MLFLAPPVWAADLYRYETEEGTVSYTDDPKHIPSRYREDAVREPARHLVDYPRLTVVGKPPKGAETSATDGERDPFASRGSEIVAPSVPASPGHSTFEYGIGGGASIHAPVESTDPIRVRRNQWRAVDDGTLTYWKPFTVIQQGERVIAEIEPK